MSFAGITSMLQEAIGLDAASIGSEAIRHAIRRRMRQSAVADEADFLALLQASPTEMTAMIEEVVVPETWFFRQAEAFRLMQEHLSGAWRRARLGRVPRLLSIPCSSGEEAYSMAMSLLDSGFTVREFHIDAIDISQQHLNKANLAIYGKSSFRGDDLDFRQRYFKQTDAGYALSAPVRHAVHFHRANILDHDHMQAFGSYDIIYCRNLLIYFTQNDRKKTAELLARMLTKDGLLFVGHAETGGLWKDLFASVAHPMAFAYRPVSNEDMVIHATRPNKQAPARYAFSKQSVALPGGRSGGQQATRPLPVAPVVPLQPGALSAMDNRETPNLEHASRLADQGDLQEARRQCEAYLQAQGASAQAWFLLGLTSATQGHKEQAKDGFRKALYLEPDHYQALVHLALLLDELGEHKAARHLRARIQRASNSQTVGADGS